jgi:hypothetical protein
MATCSLRAALSLGLTLGLCRATPTPPQLRVFPKVDEQTATEMIAKCAVHGRYEELLVVHGACGMAQGIVPTESFDLGHVNSSEYYVVLEYQPSPADAPREQWLVDVPRTAPQDMRVLFTAQTRYVVSFPRTLVQQLPSGMPLSTEYLVVRERPLRPMASHPVLAAKLARAQANTSAENPLIRDALNRITGSALSSTLNMLTTTWNTRNSFAPEAREAADVIGAHFERYGFNVSMEEARPDMSPNVIATLEGTEEPNRWVVIGAHYDSRGVDNQSPTEPSPGANDDGTGTAVPFAARTLCCLPGAVPPLRNLPALSSKIGAGRSLAQALMEIARSISESGLTFKYSLMLAAFTGEEQGLFGSRAKAAEQADQGKDILAMFALDMLAYRREGVGPQVVRGIAASATVCGRFYGGYPHPFRKEGTRGVGRGGLC